VLRSHVAEIGTSREFPYQGIYEVSWLSDVSRLSLEETAFSLVHDELRTRSSRTAKRQRVGHQRDQKIANWVN
jgi:hypothetical protein